VPTLRKNRLGWLRSARRRRDALGTRGSTLHLSQRFRGHASQRHCAQGAAADPELTRSAERGGDPAAEEAAHGQIRVSKMDSVRGATSTLEGVVAERLWPLPTHQEILENL
jgi:hypothetical protein